MSHPPRQLALPALLLAAACQTPSSDDAFARDVAFLQRHVTTLVLESPGGAKVAIVPAWQGRVMTSTVGGPGAPSFGWLNRERIAAGGFVPQFNAFGGEDRFWLGPEGGQFSLYFAPGAPFELSAWQVPPPIDSEPFELVAHSPSHARFRRHFTVANRAGTRFHCEVERVVRLEDPAAVLRELGTAAGPGVRGVTFASHNTLRNVGRQAWTTTGGLLSVWILGMFEASPHCTVLVPFLPGPESEFGPIVNDEYFGRVPPERLQVDAARGLIRFAADARQRGKIGVGRSRARPVLGSWDATNGVLTIVDFSLPPGGTRYVNSQWREQDDPYAGDVVNSYNDGPSTPDGAGFGNFYELETSSPALALAPGEAATHVHRTTHLTGPVTELQRIAARLFGAELAQLPALPESTAR